MSVDYADGLAFADVPDDDEVIETCAEEDILGCRMPLDVADTTLVALKLHQPVG